MKSVGLISISAAFIGSLGLLQTSLVHADFHEGQSASKNTTKYEWVTDFRSKPPFKRTRVAVDANSEPRQIASTAERATDRIKIGPRGKNRLISRYRSTAPAANETASFARFEEVSGDTNEAPACRRRGAPGKSLPALRRC